MRSFTKLAVSLVAVTAVLACFTSSAMAGPNNGPQTYSNRFINGGQKQSFVLNCSGLTKVTVISHSGQDMDVYVKGVLTGNNYGQDNHAAQNAYVTFTPILPGIFEITVHNYSGFGGLYTLRVE